MTAREKIEAEDKKLEIYNVRGAICEVCHKILMYSEAQLAHRINKGKGNLKKYGKKIIHHPLNLALTCSDGFNRCNDSVNISNNPMAVVKLVKEIEDSLSD